MSDSIFSRIGLPGEGVHEAPHARRVLLSGFRPSDPGAARREQTLDVFGQMQKSLRAEGCEFAHVVRTWFFLDDILGWYDEFNAARSAFFSDHRVFDGVVPASTGVGVGGLDAALAGAVLAVKPHAGLTEVEAVPSPLQCPALDYKSSFSRAVEVRTPRDRTLYISGTASIDVAGNSAYIGDIGRQIDLTLEVVDALLVSRAMDWAHVNRAVAYFPDLRNAPPLAPRLASVGIRPGVVRCVEATICRPELLFELEVDAVRPAG